MPPATHRTADRILEAGQTLRQCLADLRFAPPVAFTYNPLEYAWEAYALYVKRYGRGRRRVLIVGMNPGPWGMAQTGIPFGEVAAVRDWLGIDAPIDTPASCHPSRPVQGLACARSEVSGRRLWGLFQERYGTAKAFFADHFVLNHCPLMFLEAGGRNRTPDKLPASERDSLLAVCDAHLRTVITALQPTHAVGVGAYAEQRLRTVLGDETTIIITRILHPSPASPAANRGWASKAIEQLQACGAWSA